MRSVIRSLSRFLLFAGAFGATFNFPEVAQVVVAFLAAASAVILFDYLVPSEDGR